METTTAMRQIMDAVRNTMDNLYVRWLDECEYEDIRDYGEVIRPIVERAGGVFIKMTARPFGFQVIVNGFPVQYGATMRKVYMKVIDKQIIAYPLNQIRLMKDSPKKKYMLLRECQLRQLNANASMTIEELEHMLPKKIAYPKAKA